jgi:GNAT superfamily N-acetyltransferase
MQRMNLSTVQKAEIALDNYLYKSGWAMYVMYRHAIRFPQMYRIELHEENGRYVAAMAVKVRSSPTRKSNKYTVAVFVDLTYRRKGIGTKLLALLGDDIRKCKAGSGVSGSLDFWRANNVTCFTDQDHADWETTLTDIEIDQRELEKCSTNQKPNLLSNVSCIATKSATRLKETLVKSCTRTRSSPKENSYQSM